MATTAKAPARNATADASAKDAITGFLAQYGLGGLGTFAWNEYLHGTPISQIMLDIRKTPEYTARFPAMAALAQKGQAMSEAQYLNLEQSYKEIFHSYGLPAGFYDQPADFAKFMTADVSPSELQNRVQAYTTAVMSDPETLHQLTKLYGDIGHSNNPAGDLLAHYLDPTAAAPLLAQQLSAAQFAGAGVNSGYGQVSAADALRYGAQAGTTPDQAQQGFAALLHGKELFTGLPGENQTDISQQTQLGAEFGGNAAGQEQIQKRAKLRVAEGNGGGGFATTQRGSTIGSNEV